MPIDTGWMPAMRRFAAGIDLAERELRLVVVGWRGRSFAAARVEWLGATPLPCSAMAAGHIGEHRAIASALAALLARWPAARTVRALPCAMAVPGSLTWVASMPLPEPGFAARPRAGAPDPLESAARAYAERIAGIEREALAVDWRVERVADDPAEAGAGAGAGGESSAYLTIAATARLHLEARAEAAAAAGVALVAVDSEPAAALRALAQTAALELRDAGRFAGRFTARFAALWAGNDGVYGWRICGSTIEAHVYCPASRLSVLPDALRELASPHALACGVAGGDLDALALESLALADVADLLGCGVLSFACAPFLAAEASLSSAPMRACALEPKFAVAHGLALRGVDS